MADDNKPIEFTPFGGGKVTITSYTILQISPTIKNMFGGAPSERDKAAAVYMALKGLGSYTISVSKLAEYVKRCDDCSFLIVKVNGELICRIGLEA